MKRIRIAHCLEAVGSGGVEQRRLTLARALDPDRYEQMMICLSATPALAERFERAGCRVHVLTEGASTPRHILEAAGVLKAWRPHIVHGAVFGGVGLAVTAGRLAGGAKIVGEETSDPMNRRWRGHLLYRLLCAGADRMVAVSPAVESYLVEKIRLPRRKVVRIDNGVAEPPAADANEVSRLRASLGIAPDDLIVGTVNRLLDQHKKVSDLIAAVALARRRFPKLRLLVVGDGPDRAALERLAADHGGCAIFAGYQIDPRPWLEMMNIFALASAYEAFGLVLVEAMFARLPVVATRVGGIPHIVQSGETGLLVPPGRPAEMAAAICDLLANAEHCEAMGLRGLERARRCFGADRYVRQVDALYRSLLGGDAAA